MRSARTVLAAGVAAAAIALPGTAIAQFADTGDDAAAAVSKRNNTWIKFLSFDHVRGFLSDTTIVGQVAYRLADGSAAAAPGVRVRLLRKPAGSSQWRPLGHDYTSKSTGKFVFTLRSRGNAAYRVVYKGNRRLQPSRARTHVWVFRRFHAQLEDVTGRFHGRVSPHYAHKRIFLQKRSCSDCSWHHARSKRTGDRGHFHFMVGAPDRGRFWWRARTPASTRFIESYSAVFTTARA
jgi:hypothetical protein